MYLWASPVIAGTYGAEMMDVTPNAQRPYTIVNEKRINAGIVEFIPARSGKGNLKGPAKQPAQHAAVGHDYNAS